MFEVVDLKLSIYLGERPSPNNLLGPDILADPNVVSS
jgi:hypothetical protein